MTKKKLIECRKAGKTVECLYFGKWYKVLNANRGSVLIATRFDYIWITGGAETRIISYKFNTCDKVTIDGREFTITDRQNHGGENFYRLNGNENYVSESYITK